MSCLGATHIPKRWDESGKPYAATADDAAYATFELGTGGGHRADQQLVGDARAPRRPRHLPRRRHARLGGRRPAPTAAPQPRVDTPQAGVEPGRAADDRLLRARGRRCPTTAVYDNGFKVAVGAVHPPRRRGRAVPLDLLEGAKGVQLVELGLQSWKERRWIDVPRARRSEARRCTTLDAARAPTARSRAYTLRGRSRVRRAPARAALQPRRLFAPRTSSPIRCAAVDPWLDAAIDWDATHRLPPAPLVAGPRRRRGDGHRAARHGPRLADVARADPALARRGARRARRAASPRGCRHRPPRAATRRRRVDDVIRAYEEQMRGDRERSAAASS